MTSPPVKYVRQASYTDFSTQHPNDQQSGTNLDADFGAVLTSNNQIIDRLGQVQRSDGALANLCVTPDSFSAGSLALIAGTGTPKGAWLTTVAYVVKDLVSQAGLTYICVTAHVAGVFATDLAAGKWLLFSPGFTPFVLNTVSGLVGINMTPVNVLDVAALASANTPTIVQVANANAGTAARADFRAFNGTSTMFIAMLGTGFTPGNVQRAGGGLINADGPGGLTLNTSLNQPIFLCVNSVQIGQIASTGVNFTLSGTAGDVLALRGGAATKMQMTLGRSAADWTIGIAAAVGQYVAGSLAGDLVFFSNAQAFSVSTDNGASASFIVSGANIFAPNASTTASGANVFMDNAASNKLMRVTSSARYKTDFQPLDLAHAITMVNALRPGTYLSTAPSDDPTIRHIGVLAEDAAKGAPELVQFVPAENAKGTFPKNYTDSATYLAANSINGLLPESFQYDRSTMPMAVVLQWLVAEDAVFKGRLAAAGIP